jgi:adenosylhomocysteine nucleosidase
MIAITFALTAESSDFIRSLQQRKRQAQGVVSSTEGVIHGKSVAVFHTGVGEESCRRRIKQILSEGPFEYLISAGFAGGLGGEMDVGDILIAKNFSDAELRNHRPNANGVFYGTLITAKGVIDNLADRDCLQKESGALAVDMETEFIAAACATNGVPMLSVRVVSDTPAKPLPTPANVLFDIGKQKTNLPRLSLYLAGHPQKVPGLIGFHRQVILARRSLTKALVNLIGLI